MVAKSGRNLKDAIGSLLTPTFTYRINNFIPGKMEELGIGYDVASKINPSLIFASISGKLRTLNINGVNSLNNGRLSF
jgi:hypothetical protein